MDSRGAPRSATESADGLDDVGDFVVAGDEQHAAAGVDRQRLRGRVRAVDARHDADAHRARHAAARLLGGLDADNRVGVRGRALPVRARAADEHGGEARELQRREGVGDAVGKLQVGGDDRGHGLYPRRA